MPDFMSDLFTNTPQRRIEVTNQVNEIIPVPTLLGGIPGLFTTRAVSTRVIAIQRIGRTNRLIPVSPIGAPPVELEVEGGDVRPFFLRRIAKGSTVYAEELQGVTDFFDFQNLRTLETEVARRAARIRDDIALTNEYQRFGAVQGIVVDADGTTVLDNWFTNWGVAAPVAFNFHLDVDTTNIRQIADDVVTTIRQSTVDGWVPGRTRVHALTGNDFFTQMISHPAYERAYLNTPNAGQVIQAMPEVVDAFGIIWHRWVDGGNLPDEFSIPSDEVRFYPVGANEAFQKLLGPAEFDPFINQPGREVYGMNIPDRDRGAWLRTEQYQYPLFMCLRPEMLQKGVAS